MENVGDALKMAFAVLVFVIAMWIAFSLLGQANATAKEIFFSMDKITYIEPERVGGSEANNRIVGLETIIPAIYRYSVENYGVTIINKDNSGKPVLVARYDTETENVARHIKNALAYKNNPNIALYAEANRIYSSHIDYLVKVLKWNGTGFDNEGTDEIYYNEGLDKKIRELYSYKIISADNNETDAYGAPWGAEYVAERIKTDLTGVEYNIGGCKYNPFKDDGLLKLMKGNQYQYKEYIIEEGTEYKVLNYEDKYGGETQSSGTAKTTKLEIIYVQQ